LARIEDSDVFADEVPGRHHEGGIAQARFQRHHEAHVHWHLKRLNSTFPNSCSSAGSIG
jgi:peptide subunit release factor 1 (eRF1)